MYCGINSYFTEKSNLWNNKREVGLFLRVDLFLGDYDVKRVDDVQAISYMIVWILFYRGYSLNVYHLNHIIYILLKLQQSISTKV